jgi:hypothetical protein
MTLVLGGNPAAKAWVSSHSFASAQTMARLLMLGMVGWVVVVVEELFTPVGIRLAEGTHRVFVGRALGVPLNCARPHRAGSAGTGDCPVSAPTSLQAAAAASVAGDTISTSTIAAGGGTAAASGNKGFQVAASERPTPTPTPKPIVRIAQSCNRLELFPILITPGKKRITPLFMRFITVPSITQTVQDELSVWRVPC